MSSPIAWSRRSFLSALGLTGAAAVAPRILAAEGLRSSITFNHEPFLAFVGFSASTTGKVHRVESYRVEDGVWRAAASAMPAENPHALALHPTLPVLYVAHSNAQHRNLPRGSVSAFMVDSASGALAPLSHEGLALSATYPDHLAVSPDGRTLLVSATGGGSYNFFSLGADGAIFPTAYPLKQTGSGPHALQDAAHPRAAVFETNGAAAYATDLGSDRIDHIAFDGGVPKVQSRISFSPGSGPADLVLHPSGELAVVASRLRPALSVVSIDAGSGDLRAITEHHPLDTEFAGPVVLSQSGDHLYLASTLDSSRTVVSVFYLARSTGRLRSLQDVSVSGIGRPEQLLRLEDQLLLTGTGGVVSLPLSARSEDLGEPRLVLGSPDAVSLAVRGL